MCGISGLVKLNHNTVEKLEIHKMNSIIEHRGPDGEGIFVENNLGLGHRRLSIIDLSELGNQPMSWKDFIITYNGEIYNYLEIRDTLKSHGYFFRTNTDTEVILASYDYWGFECVKEFNGMWSFAIFDRKKNLLFCSRDRFGIKPFYYLLNNTTFAFASEIKQLLDFEGSRKVNWKQISDYLIFGESENESSTFFEKIFKLPGSHSLVYYLDSNTYEINKYYDISLNKDYFTLDLVNASLKLKELIEDSVKLRLRSDVKVGSCLSGGLDSSTIVRIASKFQNFEDKLNVINAKSIDEKFDESLYAIKVSEICDTNLHITKPDISDFKTSLEKVIYAQDEPFTSPSIIFQYHVFKEAKKQDCIVMLDGQGGDENLLGYDYYIGPILRRKKIIEFYKNVISIKRNSGITIQQIIYQLFYLFFPGITKSSLYIRFKNKILKKELINIRTKKNKSKRNKTFRNKSLFELQKYEFFNGSLLPLLRYEDKNSMAHSIESRLPFLDYRIVEFCLSLPLNLKHQNGWSKFILRNIMDKNLPDSIVWRRNKLGFNAPDNIWLSETQNIHYEILNSKIMDFCIDKKKLNMLKGPLKWRLYNIALWEKIFSVQL